MKKSRNSDWLRVVRLIPNSAILCYQCKYSVITVQISVITFWREKLYSHNQTQTLENVSENLKLLVCKSLSTVHIKLSKSLKLPLVRVCIKLYANMITWPFSTS